MKKIILAAALTLTSMSSHACFSNTAVGDAISTKIAIQNVTGAYEANPLGVGGVLVSKAVVYAGMKYSDDATRANIEKVTCPLQAGLTGNNLAVAMGAGSGAGVLAPVIGVITGLLYMMGADFGPVDQIYNDEEN